jgi:hypothetical protein
VTEQEVPLPQSLHPVTLRRRNHSYLLQSDSAAAIPSYSLHASMSSPDVYRSDGASDNATSVTR